MRIYARLKMNLTTVWSRWGYDFWREFKTSKREILFNTIANGGLENNKVSISITMLIYITKSANIPINKLVNDSIEVSRNKYNKKLFN